MEWTPLLLRPDDGVAWGKNEVLGQKLPHCHLVLHISPVGHLAFHPRSLQLIW